MSNPASARLDETRNRFPDLSTRPVPRRPHLPLGDASSFAQTLRNSRLAHASASLKSAPARHAASHSNSLTEPTGRSADPADFSAKHATSTSPSLDKGSLDATNPLPVDDQPVTDTPDAVAPEALESDDQAPEPSKLDTSTPVTHDDARAARPVENESAPAAAPVPDKSTSTATSSARTDVLPQPPSQPAPTDIVHSRPAGNRTPDDAHSNPDRPGRFPINSRSGDQSASGNQNNRQSTDAGSGSADQHGDSATALPLSRSRSPHSAAVTTSPSHNDPTGLPDDASSSSAVAQSQGKSARKSTTTPDADETRSRSPVTALPLLPDEQRSTSSASADSGSDAAADRSVESRPAAPTGTSNNSTDPALAAARAARPVAVDSLNTLLRSSDTGSAQQSALRPGPQASDSQVVRGVLAMTRTNGGALNIKLNPPSLGALRVQMSVTDGRVTVQFHAETREARHLLHQGLESLRSALEGQGLKVDSMSIHSLSRALSSSTPAATSSSPSSPAPSSPGASEDRPTTESGADRDASRGQSRGRQELPGREDHSRAKSDWPSRTDFPGQFNRNSSQSDWRLPLPHRDTPTPAPARR